MSADIDIIMRVFIKNSYSKYLQIGGERPQLKVPMKALCEFSHFFSFSLGKEL